MIELTQQKLPAMLDMAKIRENYLPVGRSTLFRMISCGQFPSADFKQGAKLRLWKKETVESWLDQQQAKVRR